MKRMIKETLEKKFVDENCYFTMQDIQDQQQQQSNPNKDEMSDQAAEQLLNSAQQDEKSVQQKLNKNKNGKRRNLEKDW